MNLPWLDSLEASWRISVAQERAPHSVLLLGAQGSGKRCVAAWMARLHLRPGDTAIAAEYPRPSLQHADLRWITPPDDKHAIGIEQIRTLVSELALTSYAGRGKVAVIDPANAMTASAANSLLKTLEEPPGNALLILIADRTGRLPATIFSRCQRFRIDLPAAEEAIRWLDQVRPGQRWGRLLREAGNAPLAALAAAERQEDAAGLERDFVALANHQAAPLEVAGRWAGHEPEFVLQWLARRVQDCIRGIFGGLSASDAAGLGQSVLQHIDRQNLFCYLDTINGLKGQPAGSFNLLLTLESLLIDWAGNLKSHQGLTHPALITTPLAIEKQQ
jgi:DNA polymerase-3 subunit delta'